MKKEILVRTYHKLNSNLTFKLTYPRLLKELHEFLFDNKNEAANLSLDDSISFTSFENYLERKNKCELIQSISDNEIKDFITNWKSSSSYSFFSDHKFSKQFHIDEKIQGDRKLTVVEKIVGNPPPVVNYYRSQVYNYFASKNGVYCETRPSIKKISDVSESITKDLTDFHYYARVTLGGDLDQWQPLPCLTSQDVITALKANSDVELGYCEITNQYYVRTNAITANELIIEYNLKSISPKQFSPESFLPKNNKEIQNDLKTFCFKEAKSFDRLSKLRRLNDYEKVSVLADFILNFSVTPLPNTEKIRKQSETLDAILMNRTGECRHRALLFMAFAELLNLKARMIVSDIHAFIEVNIDNSWYRVDLGGGNANLTVWPIPGFETFNLSKLLNKYSFVKTVNLFDLKISALNLDQLTNFVDLKKLVSANKDYLPEMKCFIESKLEENKMDLIHK